MGQAQQSELAKDRALQEQLHSQAMRELQEMKVREDELVQVEKVRDAFGLLTPGSQSALEMGR